MKYKFLSTLFKVIFLSVFFHFIYLFIGYNGGGIAMAPFVFVPIVLIEGLLIILINFIFKLFRKNISDIFNISLFLIIFTLFMFYESSWLFFHNLFSNELLVGHTTRLMYLPVIFGTICVFLYEKRKCFFN